MGLYSRTRRIIRCRWCGCDFLWGKVRIPNLARLFRHEPGICTHCSSQLARQMDRCQNLQPEAAPLIAAERKMRAAG